MNIYILSGPSGVGKSSVAKELKNIQRMKSYTSRSTDDDEYHAVSRKEFQNMILNKQFIEYEEIYHNYYGSIHPKDSTNNLYVIDYKGGLSIRNQYPNAITIAMIPSSISILKMRLINRKRDINIETRLERSEQEIQTLRETYKYIITNTNLQSSINVIQSIIDSESGFH